MMILKIDRQGSSCGMHLFLCLFFDMSTGGVQKNNHGWLLFSCKYSKVVESIGEIEGV